MTSQLPRNTRGAEELRALDDDALKLRSDECEFGCGGAALVPLVHAELRRRGIEIPEVQGA